MSEWELPDALNKACLQVYISSLGLNSFPLLIGTQLNNSSQTILTVKMKSESPSVSDSAVGNVTNEAVLKEISAQLRSNKKHVKKLRREVRDNKEDTKNLLMKLRQEFQVNKKHLKTLHREVQDGKKEIEDCKKRLDAM